MKQQSRRSANWGRRATAAVALAAFLFLGQSSAWAKGKKFSSDLKLSDKGSANVDVIVQYKDVSAKHVSKAQGRGAHIKHQFKSIKALAMSIPANELKTLASEDSDITYVSPDRDVAGEGVSEGFYATNSDLARSTGWDG